MKKPSKKVGIVSARRNRISPGWKTEQNGEDGLLSKMWAVDPKALGEHLSGKI